MASSKVASRQELSPFGHALAGALGGVFSNAYETGFCDRPAGLTHVVVLEWYILWTRQWSMTAIPRDLLTDPITHSVKTRIQAADGKGKGKAVTPSVYQLLIKIWNKEGISGYYKGFGASMLNTFSTRESSPTRWKLVSTHALLLL